MGRSILLIFSHVALVFGYERTYEFGKDCLLNTTDVDENDKIHVEYNGKTVDFGCHYFKFRRRKYGFLDEHSLCVTPLYFNDSDCAVDIDIKTSLSGIMQHKIACIANESVQYCGLKNKTLFIEFKKRYGKDTHKVRFKLKITAKKDYDLWIAICCYWMFRRKSSQKSVFNPTQLHVYLSTEIPYVIYSAQTQQSMMATPSNISSPGVYPMSSCAPPQSDSSPRTTDINVSDVPPSYEEYMASHVTETI
eukprot:XP_011438329.1 PREDICTED: uncharacterized protein LOC105335890 isoform X2 [Crassostrea gigas]